MKDKCVVTQVKRVSTLMKIEVCKVAQNLTFLCFFFLDELGSFSCSEINEVNNA